MQIVRDIDFKGELAIEGNILCWSSIDGDCVIFFDTNTDQEMLKINIGDSAILVNEVFDRSKYIKIVDGNQLNLSCIDSSISIKMSVENYSPKNSSNGKSFIFSDYYDVVSLDDKKVSVLEIAMKAKLKLH